MAINKELEKERTYDIIKSNDLIQKTRFELSLQEQKIIMYLISKIKPDDKNLRELEFDILNFCKVCGIDFDNGKNYKNVKNTLQKLYDKSSWIEVGNKEILFSWLSTVEIEKRKGTIKIRLNEFLEPHLLELKEKFTKYSLYYVLAMKSQYSIRLYEILKSYEYKKSVRFEIDELKKRLGAEKFYKKFSDFRRNILEISFDEINNFSDINITYTLEKKSRTFTHITFYIKFKDDIGNRLKTFKTVEKGINNNFENSYLNKL